MVEKIVTDKLKLDITVIRTESGFHRYSAMYKWNDKEPLAMIVTNWPGSIDPLKLDETTHQIIKHVHLLGYGGAILVNLFSQVGLTTRTKSRLKKAISTENLAQITSLITKVDVVIIATGSLPRLNEIAADEQTQLIGLVRSAKPSPKLKFLGTKRYHPSHPLTPEIRSDWHLYEENQLKG